MIGCETFGVAGKYRKKMLTMPWKMICCAFVCGFLCAIIERIAVRDNKFIYEQHEHKEGFVGIRREDFYNICSKGSARLRSFRSITEDEHILRLAFEPPQPSIAVGIHDLVVLREDRIKFEKAYNFTKSNVAVITKTGFTASNDYRHIVLDGEEYHLGDVQASIVQQLHDAASSRNHWVHGKTLLDAANSHAIRLRDVFKSKNEWQKIIVSNKRGYYRLNLPETMVQLLVAQAA